MFRQKLGSIGLQLICSLRLSLSTMVAVCAVVSAEISRPDKARALTKSGLEKKVQGRIAANGECVSDMEILCIEVGR
jgi:hypothetical protein